MKIEVLKSLIENKQPVELPLIFVCAGTDFVAMQYTDAIAKNSHREVVRVDDMEKIPSSSPFLAAPNLYLYRVDKLKEVPAVENIIIITSAISKDIEEGLADYIVEVPALQDWQLEEYVNVICKGLQKEDIKWLLKISKSDPYRLMLEVDKIVIFPEITRHTMFEEFKRSGVFENAAEFNIFSLSTAIQSRNIDVIRKVLTDAKYIDLEPTGLITIMYNNIKNLIKVWGSKQPTPESTGLRSNQIYAISRSPRTYSMSQLVAAFKLVASLDRKIKEGNFPVELTVDYITTKLLTGV